jgi:hypothetical protein
MQQPHMALGHLNRCLEWLWHAHACQNNSVGSPAALLLARVLHCESQLCTRLWPRVPTHMYGVLSTCSGLGCCSSESQRKANLQVSTTSHPDESEPQENGMFARTTELDIGNITNSNTGMNTLCLCGRYVMKGHGSHP